MAKVTVSVGLLMMVIAIGLIVSSSPWDDARRPPGPGAGELVESRPLDVHSPGERAVLAAREGAVVVENLCSTCHVLPPPDVEPKRLWPQKIREMYGYAQNERPIPKSKLPPIEVPTEYFTARAPEYLPLAEGAIGSPPSPLAFTRRLITLEAIPEVSAVSSVTFVRLTDESPTQLLVCDMRHGVVVLWTPSRIDEPARVIGRIAHPSHTHVVDLDGDGLRDILVANLGIFWPQDTTDGSVVWLRSLGNEQFEPISLMEGANRVNSVRTADFDGDDDLDLVIAVFGNLTSGSIAYFENLTEDYSQPDFEGISLDDRTGTSDVPVVDLNGDGHPDFIALQSQENDHVLAFLNRGWGSFKTETIYKAPHPRWGSTGIRIIDLDSDGDFDVLFNHGDSFQIPPIPRPYHGFGWLENRGTFPFTYHRLTHLPGAHTSLPADMDGDGDLDLVSCAFIPPFNMEWPNAQLMETVVWLEQTSPGRYQRYFLELGTPFHPCGDLGDYDDDGDIDIVLGNFVMSANGNDIWEFSITVLENSLVSLSE
jgi:hypothetical protein